MPCNQRTLGRRNICEVDGQSWLEAAHALSSGSAGYVYFVDPFHPATSLNNDGRDMDYPLPTAAAAQAKCRPYRNDQIAVAMNSYWTYSSPAYPRYAAITENLTVTVPGIRIVGLSPSSSLGVPWTPSADNQELITVEAMDVVIEGFNFWDGGHNNALGVLGHWDGPPYGENLTVRDCYFQGLDYAVALDYSWNCYIERCRFDGITTHAIFNPSVYGEPDYLTIRDCVFVNCGGAITLPDCEDELIEHCHFMECTTAITITGATDCTIHGCTINGNAAGANTMINLTGGSDNLVSGNMLSCTIAQYDTTCSDATSGYWVNNWCTDGSPVAPPT